ncbi:MAG TPA: mechanosensitive ion channel domain-containing protein [Gammaproteobacteria bacterium]|nr:mechanosensitive ion channel domain-containing protein [Gammaproteobacteria bacterium]
MNAATRACFRWLLLMVALLPVAAAWAQAPDQAQQLSQLDRTLDHIDRELKAGHPSEDSLHQWVKEITTGKSLASSCVTDTEQQLKKVKQDITSLGKPVKGESSDVVARRRSLDEKKNTLEKRQASCRLLVQRADDAMSRVTALQQQRLARHLFARGPSFYKVLVDNWQQPAVWLRSAERFVVSDSGLAQITAVQRIILAAILLVGLATGFAVRHLMFNWVQEHHWRVSFAGRFRRSLLTTLSHYMPQLLFSVAAAAFMYFTMGQIQPLPFLGVLAYGLPPYFLFIVAIHLFLAPSPPGKLFLEVPPGPAKALARRLQVLATLAFVGYLLFATLLTQSFPESAVQLARGVFVPALMLNMMWALFLFGRMPGSFVGSLWLRVPLHLLLLAVVACEWLGYRNLAIVGFRTVLGTLLALGLLRFIGRLLSDFYDSLDEGRQAWQRRLRETVGLKPGDPMPGLVAVRATTTVLLWAAFVLGILRVWGLSETAVAQVQGYLVNGFTIGSLHIIPARILAAALTLLVLVAVTGWFRARLERRWLIKTHMERGAREALVAVTGYTGMAISILVALGVAGLQYKNLAIVAGALSLGIGFGLQNIVNNFVSGLILLFERPIRTGDWIVVGSTEGYVKRIRIRSTQIQTFDRADVIVPNSELISTQVTNWMLYDLRGRVRVPVGVAYGSDTALVKQLLIDAGAAHPQVITDGSAPEPVVLFLEFGDSSLNFELRVYIREIDMKLSVTSDLNFAIDAAFREHGVEIPFPQRDVHVRDWPAPPRPPLPPQPPADGTGA